MNREDCLRRKFNFSSYVAYGREENKNKNKNKNKKKKFEIYTVLDIRITLNYLIGCDFSLVFFSFNYFLFFFFLFARTQETKFSF